MQRRTPQTKASKGRKTMVQGNAQDPVCEGSPNSERVEQGALPEGWQKVTLADVVLKARQRNPRLEPDKSFDYVDVSSISRESLGIQSTTRYLGKDAPSRARKAVQAGDVIFATVRPTLRRVALVPPELDGQVCSTAFCVIRADPQLADQQYLFFVIAYEDFVKRISEQQRGVSYPAITDRQVLSGWIPLPPIPEQRAIAAVLRTVQRAKEACEQVIATTRQLKASLLHHLFTYGPVPFDQAAHVPLKETEIGKVPEHWSMKHLCDVASIERGKFAHRPRNEPRFYGGLIPFIQTGDVTRSGGRIQTYTQTLNEAGLSLSRVFPKGTIVLTIAANIGDVAILEFDCAFPDSLVGITPKGDAIERDYLLRFLQTQKSEMDRLAPRGTQKNINIRFLEPWPILVPPLSEQREIARQLAAVDAKLAAEEVRRDSLAAVFTSLLHHLMTGRLRLPEFVGGKA